MKQWAAQKKGFTIVELLIVIVVIAILAAITVISYNGIKERAIAAQVQAALSEANKKVRLYAAEPAHAGSYPATLADVGVNDTSTVAYQYSVDSSVSPERYLITASNGIAGTTTYYMGSNVSSPTVGVAPGHNLMPWDKSGDSTTPVELANGIAVDTSTYHTATASIKIPPGVTNRPLRASPISGEPGQTVTTTIWLKTDSGWDGTNGNSKIRYSSGSTLLGACGYQGVKLNWTKVSCDYTLTSTYSTINVSVGNSGTVGNIWVDDISVSLQ